MTASGAAIKLQARDGDKVLEPYRHGVARSSLARLVDVVAEEVKRCSMWTIHSVLSAATNYPQRMLMILFSMGNPDSADHSADHTKALPMPLPCRLLMTL